MSPFTISGSTMMHRKQPALPTLLSHLGRGVLRRRVAPTEIIDPQRLLETQRQAEIEQELSLARDIQQGLLLEAVPRLPGYEISAVSLPARDLGGDLYDFLTLGNGHHGIMIGDVSGKGLPAALRMAVARTVFRHEARRGMSPAATLADVNRNVIADIPHGMVTMLYTTLDLHTGVLRMANAGHNFPIVLNGSVSEIELTGLPLGVDAESDYNELVYQLDYGDTVILFTDGVIEAVSPTGEIFGDDRFQVLLRTWAGLKPRAVVARLLHELRAWSGGTQADDITLVVMRRRSAYLGEELRLAAVDVLGVERVQELWATLPLPGNDAPAAAWATLLPDILQRVQSQFGRGLTRELSGQLRVVLEEYR